MDINKNITLLIADDEASIRNGLSTVVPWEEFGIMIVGKAQNGEEAYDIIKKCHPDIVITDIRMPGMSGLEMMEKVKQENIHTNFIILSGYGDFQYAQKAIQLGAKNYFLKPIKIDELVTEIRNIKETILQSDHINSFTAYLNVKSDPKEKFMKQLINNEFHSYEQIKNEINRLGLMLEDGPYRVMVFSILKDDDIEIEEEYQQINYLIDIIKDELAKTKHELLISKSTELLAIIHTKQPDGLGVDYHLLARRCIKRVEKDSNIKLLIGIGNENQHLTYCSNSYKIALLGLSYSFYQIQTKIFDESIICSEQPPKVSNNLHYNQLFYSITMNQEEQIKEFCKEYFSNLLYVQMPPPNYIRGMCIYLITDVMKEFSYNQEENKVFKQTEIVTHINQIKKFDDLKSYIEDFLKDCGKRQEANGKTSINPVIQAAEYFIKAHIGEKILAKDVASHVNLSDVYFTSYFKVNSGTNFRDYVIQKKMEYAMNLMEKNPQLPIAEVAGTVGYDDYRSFYRVFKQYTGVNPSNYNRRGIEANDKGKEYEKK
jgi:two-component system response regulator YesN